MANTRTIQRVSEEEADRSGGAETTRLGSFESVRSMVRAARVFSRAMTGSVVRERGGLLRLARFGCAPDSVGGFGFGLDGR